MHRLCPLSTVAAIALFFGTAGAAGPSLTESEQTAVSAIDRYLDERCQQEEIAPANLANDSEFLRRSYLDFIGRIPTVGETRLFLQESSADKRQQLIGDLLSQPDHATHLATLWREDLLATVENREVIPPDSIRLLDHWLRTRFLENDGYQTLAAGLLTATGSQPADRGAAVYITAHQAAPVRLAAGSSRMFLGIQLDCAQCHDHPFTQWSQRDFWSYSALFSQIKTTPDPDGSMLTQITDGATQPVMIQDSNEIVDAAFLGSDHPLAKEGNFRVALAEWLASPENPFFAKAAVNRLWATLFGYGLVHPIDDLGDHNAPSHPELLDFLAEDFTAHGYDVRRTLRILANTNAYQRSSTGAGVADPRLFARKTVRPLTPRQLHASLRTAAGLLPAPEADPEAAQFVQRFENATSRTEYQAGIPQALLLMNGQVIATLTDPQESRLITAVAVSPFFSKAEQIETLFLATLSRPPQAAEATRCLEYLEGSTETRQGLADILWALLNSSEFALNH